MRKFCFIFLFFVLTVNESYGANPDDITADNVKRSLKVARHASMLLRDGQLEEALIGYKEAEVLSSDVNLRKIIDEIQSQIIEDTGNKATAESLRRQAIVYISERRLKAAIEKLEESLVYYDNPDVRSELAIIEGRYRAEIQKQKLALEIFHIAEQLESKGEYSAALSKLEEAEAIWNLSQILPLKQRVLRGIEKLQSEIKEASKLAEEGVKLEIKASTEQDIEILQQALEKFKNSYEIVPSPAVEMAIIQAEQNILKISMDIKEADRKAREARLLHEQGMLEAAIEAYNISLIFRKDEEVAKELKSLENMQSEISNRERQAIDLYSEAAKLEIDEKIVEALSVVNRAQRIYPRPEAEALKLRLERTILEREQRRAKGVELSERASILRGKGLFPEALDMYWESWVAWPYSSETKDAIDSLESIVKDARTTAERAKRLYNEGLALEAQERFAEAIERITGSLALIHSKEAEEKLSGLKSDLSYKRWLDTLLIEPLLLKSEPVLPMIGQFVTVRIDGSSWLNSDKLTYKWGLSDNAKDVNSVDGGKAVSFKVGSGTPITIKLEVYAKEAKDSKTPIMEKKFSMVADSYAIGISVVGMNSTHQKWNSVSKQQEPINELVTRSDILLRANIYPTVEEAVYEWSLDNETLLSGDRGNFEINIRRNAPGLSKVGVIVKEQSGIEIGRAETSFVVPIAYEDVMIDLQKAEAWKLWMESKELWAEQKRIDAIRKASEASVLDPSEPDISIGLAQLYNDNAKIEEAYYLSAVASLRKLEERHEDAIISLKESERLFPNDNKRLLILSLEADANRIRNESILAERLRAEGDWMLIQQRKVEAISKYRESIMLREDKNLLAEVLRLTEEVENENRIKNERKETLQRVFSLINKQRYSEALELLLEVLSSYEDEALSDYVEVVKQKTIEEERLKKAASVIREQAESLFKEKKHQEAFRLFHNSLEIWKDDELETWLAKEEKDYNEAQALQMRKEAEQLIRRNRRGDAVQVYRESLKFAYDKTADEIVKKADAEAARARADELIGEAQSLIKQNKPEDALEVYKLALTKVPNDQEIVVEIKKLELSLMKAVAEESDVVNLSVDTQPEYVDNQDDDEQLKAADKLLREANALYSQKKYSEALLKYKESYELSKNSKLKEFIERLEKAIENVDKANSLVRQANELYRQGKFSEALEIYQESVKIYRNPRVEEFIKKVETLIDRSK